MKNKRIRQRNTVSVNISRIIVLLSFQEIINHKKNKVSEGNKRMREASVLTQIICILIHMGFLLIFKEQKVEGAIITKVKRKRKDKKEIKISLQL